MGEDKSNRLMRKIDFFMARIYQRIPFTYIWLFRRNFIDFINSEGKISVLDIGCGDGSAMQSLGLSKNIEITGLDVYEPYLKLAKKKKLYKELIKMDVRKLRPQKKYDIVVASHILEHLSRKEGGEFIKRLEKMANKRVVIAAPVGYFPQDEYDGNIHQIHKSHWTVEDMIDLGYSVNSQGLRILWGNDNIVKKYGMFSYFLFLISIICTPLLLAKPELGTYMICKKDIKNEK